MKEPAPIRCRRGHSARQPKCPACHDIVYLFNIWLGYEATSRPPAPPPLLGDEAKEE